MAKNVYSLQLLRNGAAYATKDAAYAALQSASGLTQVDKKDGVSVLARYIDGDNIRTLVGYYAEASAMTEVGTAQSFMTIIDVEGSSSDIEELRNMIGTGVTTANTVTKQLQDLSGTTADTSETTSVVGAKKYTDDKLSKLTATTQSGESKVVIDVTQDNGKITTTSANLTGVKLDGYTVGGDDSGKVDATDTLGAALGKLQGQINGMDKAASSADGEVVITVVEADGKVTEEKSKLKDVLLTGYAKTNDTGDIAATDSVNVALSKLENKAAAITIANDDKSINVTTGTSGTNINVNIKSGEHVLAKDGNAGLYTNIALSSITPSSTTVKEEYQLTATDGSKLGDTIKIYKDSSISKIYLGYSTDTVDADSGVITSGTTGEAQSLNYVYHKEDGKYEMVHVDVSKFLVESEFASGVTADATGVVHGVVDPTSEKNSGDTASFLTVGTNGFKVDGIKQEIINRINELDASVTGGTTAGTATADHIQVVVDEADGKITAVTVNEANIADADDLAALSAKTVTEIASSNDSITVASGATTAADGTVKYDVITDASKIKMSGFTAAESGFSAISQSSSVTEAFKAVETYIIANEEVIAAALNDLEETKVENINVNGVEGTFSNKVASVTIDGADIKLDGYTSGSSSSAVVATDTVNQAIGKLENQIKDAVAGGLQQVEAGSGITVSAVADNKQTIDVKLAAVADIPNSVKENAIKFDATNKGLYIDYLDCGVY